MEFPIGYKYQELGYDGQGNIYVKHEHEVIGYGQQYQTITLPSPMYHVTSGSFVDFMDEQQLENEVKRIPITIGPHTTARPCNKSATSQK
jgi:phosphoribosylaminoimidazole carboxylase (NCAIR synthetase)